MKLRSALQLQGTHLPACNSRNVISLHGLSRSRRCSPQASSNPCVELAISLPTLSGSELLALPALGGAAIAIAAAKFAAYSQLELVRTAMLSRHIKPGGARVLQIGGSTRDLFYYPNGTVQVTAADPDLSVSLWEQAGMQAGVPVRGLKGTAASALSSSAGAAYDSVVFFDQLAAIDDLKVLLGEVWRALKPGGTFIFIQRVEGSPVAAIVRLGGPRAADSGIGDKVAAAQSWDFSQWNYAAEALDPHAVGVAVKPLQAPAKEDFSVDASAFKMVMKGKQQSRKKNRSPAEKKGFSSS